jgi:hypothetical protein
MGEGNSALKDETRVVHQSFGREVQEQLKRLETLRLRGNRKIRMKRSSSL